MDVKNYELTNPQKSIWLTEQYYKNTPINNICGSMYIDETVDFDILKKSIYQFVKDNDGFRLQLFYDKSGEIRQKVADFKEFEIELVNLESKNDISTLETNMTNKLFSLTENFLFNFKMYKLPDDKGGFLLVAHHLIYDAYTASLVTSKIINIYSAFKKGNNSPEVPTSYTNYINAENDYLASNKFEKDKEYWNEVFKTIPEIGSIPSIKQDSENSCIAERETFVISKENLARINNLCYNNKISVFNFFMGLYAIYIGRVSNLNDFVIGTPILNRSTFQEKNTPGTFISTVPFRFMLENKQSFIDFGRKIASDSFSMFRHQKYPYQNILDDIRKKNPSQPNLYDILISYQNARNNRNTSDIPYRTRWTFNDNVADSMQIHLFDINDDGTLSISYDYRTNKYSKNDIDNIHKRILHMIEQILEKPETVLDDIEIVTPDEKDIILNKFNDTTKSYTFKNSIIEIIEDIAQKYPNNIAIETEGSSITYNELLLRINKLSNYLLKYNISENSNIGIFTTRTIDTIIGILSVLKINCTYVPIDSEYPLDRISYMIENSEINYILYENIESLDKITNFNNIEKIFINYSDYENESSILEKKYNYNYNSNLYIIFTSGSTGKPKGVTISHKNMMNLIFFEEYETSILKGNHKKILQFATMSFDVSYQEIYSSLLLGNTLVLIDDTSRKDMNKLSKYIVNKGIDTLFIPPAYLKLLVEDKEIRNLLISCVKNIITAGEALVITNGIKELIEAGINVHNHYGPAETHVATAYTITKNNISTHPPIGVPISNSNIHILDNSLHLCPIATIGQIAISGDCVGNGYWNNGALTNEKFKINPYNNKRMYLTGDLGFFDYDGNIHFIGRADFQVKLNGFRVELDEIDQVLLNHPDVKSSVSVIHEENNKKYIITYFTENNSISEETLIMYLNTSLPFYMIPKKLVKLDSFPINANGKIDKRNLPKVVLSDIEDEYIEPQTNTELELSEIWKQLFNTDKIGSNYNFFDIGGDSLLAIKLSSVILAKFNVNVTVGDIFNYPTIHELSTLIDSNKNIKYNEITHCNTKEYYNLSSAQKRVYYASKMSGEDSCVYNMPGYIVFDKKPDINKLNECFKKLINRHQVLRTNFEIINNDVYQKISNTVSFEIEEVIENNKTIDEVLKDFVKPFDLSKSPLFRAKLVTSKDKILLLFDMHHIISDGLSIAILTKELSKLYNGENLDPISFNYIDYAEWEFNNLNNDNLKNSKEFWINKFKDEIPVLNMPTDYARPAIQSFSGSKIYKTISGELAEKISNLARKLDVSNYMLLLATYYILLSKYTSQEDIIVGTPVVGRNKEELLNIIGMFVNSLPLKTHIDNSMSFSDFLNIVKTNSIEAIEHQDYPFDELVNNLNLTRDSSRNPIFDTMFIYQNDGFTPISFNGLKSELYIPDTGISKFDLSLEVVPTDKEFKLSFEYSTVLFNKDTIERFSNHFINILEKIVENVNIKISEIDMLSEDEKNEILYKFNDTKMNYPKDKTIIQLFEEQVEKTPDNIAIVFENEKLTFREVNEKANQLAWYLREIGVKRNDIISIMLNRSLELLVSIIGVLKSGACYIPIDPNYPKDRVEYMLENSNSKLLLTDKSLYNTITFNNKLTVDLSSYNFSTKDTNLPCINKPDDMSYIIYTSGSTGKPKGVVLKQKSLTNLTYYLNDYVCFLNNNKYISMGSVTTASFDIFIFETLIALQKGLRVVIANEDEQRLPNMFDAFIKNNDIKAIQMTPSRMRIFVDAIDYCPNLSNLDYVVLAGEPLPDKLLKDLLNLGIKKVYNGYGPSETTVFSSFTDVTNYNIVNIGKPLSNTQMYILDTNLSPTPIGIPGELFIAGDGVGIGYLNNEEMTNERFIKNPFEENSIMYKTGDACKFLPNGEITYLERLDNQVKIRGLRIELEEIENKLLELPFIKKVKVVKQTIENRDFISAYYISDENITANEIRKFLSSSLPNYMVPSYFTKLEEFPYTPNGKIDKKALPLPNISLEENSIEYVAPRNDTETNLVKILEDILKISNISVLDNFFNLGGDSLTAIVLCTNIKQKFNVDLSFRDIINTPIIEDLANTITTSSTNSVITSSIQKCSTMEYYPTSSAQKRIYLSTIMDNNSTLYNITGGILLDKMPDVNKLENSFNIIVSSQEILRTYFEIIDGNIVQKIEKNIDVKINVEKVNTNNIDEIFKKYQSKFDLNKVPLFKVFLLELPNGKVFLMLDIHHIIFDGASLNNLINDISILYNDGTLSESPISYKDFAVWENKQLLENNFKDSKEFWIKKFKNNIPILNIPTTYPRELNKSYEGTTFVTYFSKDIEEKINILAIKYNVTPYMLMLCIYYILLYKYTGQEDIVVGSPVSGRIYKELEPLLGMFVNSIPLRTTVSADSTFEEFLQMVKESCVDAFSHQNYPFDVLVNDLNIRRNVNRNPLFDTMFIYQNKGFAKIDFGGINGFAYSPISNTSKFDISLEVVPEENGLKLSFEYCTKLFNEEFISNFATAYKNILNTVLSESDIKISDISNLEISETHLPISSELNKSNSKIVEYVAPSNRLELQIVDIFQNLLSISPIGIDDNFFELGGDSLLAINLQIELLKQNINITYSDIYMNPTVRELAKKISSSENSTFSNIDTSEFVDFNNILDNTCKLPKNIEYKALGDILISGTTGFLGAHVLDKFLQNEKGIAYCLTRPDPRLTLENKLLKKLHFYFGEKYDKYIGNRIIIVNADITKNNLGLSDEEISAIFNKVNCVINCAAKVSHFGNYNIYKEINVDATENLLKLCAKFDKRFYQVSTLSVSGNSLVDQSYIEQSFEHDVIFRENNFYINQSLDNVYVRSKFEAEKLVLQYITKGLDAYILRVGNLMNRYEDGKFQPNVDENAYINRLVSLAKIGCIPDYLLNSYMEFTPIDSCAESIIKLIQHPNKTNRIFHLYDHNHVDVYVFIKILERYINFDVVSNEEFIGKINDIFTREDSDKILSGILRDFDKNRKLVYESKVKIKSEFTINYLEKIGYIWPKIDEGYLVKFLDYFANLGYIKRKGEN